MTPLASSQVKVGGEIGRRIDATVNNNLLKLDVDRDFLAPFKVEKEKRAGAYIGLGKLIDATVRFAAYTHDDRVTALKRHLVEDEPRSVKSKFLSVRDQNSRRGVVMTSLPSSMRSQRCGPSKSLVRVSNSGKGVLVLTSRGDRGAPLR